MVGLDGGHDYYGFDLAVAALNSRIDGSAVAYFAAVCDLYFEYLLDFVTAVEYKFACYVGDS